MELVKKYILHKVASNELSRDEAKKMLLELSTGLQKNNTDIAVIGMAGRFPQADSIEEFWDNIIRGHNCIRDFPEKRKQDAKGIMENPHYAEFIMGDGNSSDTVESLRTKAGYLRRINTFDADFFGIPPREATYMAPFQRLTLETAWEALEDAGYGGERIYGTNTGVYIGKEGTAYSLFRWTGKSDPMLSTGTWESVCAGRIAYLFDLHGPCMIVDSACSSGLTAIYAASRALNNNECDMAIVGGVSVSLIGEFKGTVLDSVESEDALVRTFDKNANGTVWGEGAVTVILKRLPQAIKDNDNIQAVIKACEINSDGASNGLTAPNAAAQEALFVRAWEDAGINPETIGYIEAHGTGTVLGDPIEIKSLSNAFKRFTNKKQFCAVGTLKTNMGHLVAASGLASLVKVITSINEKMLAPSINFTEPNPFINFINGPVYINDRATPWESTGEPRRAAVNSFGFSGTNCHAVVEEYTRPEPSPAAHHAYCLTIAAKKAHILKDYIAKYADFITRTNDSLADICYTANTGRGHYAHRLAVIAESTEELTGILKRITGIDPDEIQEDQVYYGYHTVVGEQKKNRESSDITDSQKKTFSDEAARTLASIHAGSKEHASLLRDLCRSYVRGAQVAWDAYYTNETRMTVKIPVYPLERQVLWPEPRQTQLTESSLAKNLAHPLLEACVTESFDEIIYQTEFTIDKHWVLQDHKIQEHCVVPGTTYLEMIREAASHYWGDTALELRDIFFLTPLVVAPDETKVIQVILKKKAEGLGFIIAGKIEDKESSTWVKHVEGTVAVLDAAPPAPLDIAGIQARALKSEEQFRITGDTGVFQFGLRWDNVRDIYRDGDNVFLTAALDEALQEDYEHYLLHPAMLDCMVNIMNRSFGEGTYLPFTYKRFQYFKPMTGRTHCYVIPKVSPGTDVEIIPFDITITDDNGEVIAVIYDYSIKKVHALQSMLAGRSTAVPDFHTLVWKETPLDNPQMIPDQGIDPEQPPYLFFNDGSVLAGELITRYTNESITLIEVQYGDHYAKISDGKFMISGDEADFSRLFDDTGVSRFSRIIYSGGLDGNDTAETVEQLTARKDHIVTGFFYFIKALIHNKIKVDFDLVLLTAYAYAVTDGQPQINPLHAALNGVCKVAARECPGLNCRTIDTDDATGSEMIHHELSMISTDYLTAYRNNIRYREELVTVDLKEERELVIRDEGVYIITGGTGGIGRTIAAHLCAGKNRVNLALINRTPLPERSTWDDIIAENTDPKTSEKLRELQAIEQSCASVEYIHGDIGSYSIMEKHIEHLRKKYRAITGVIHAAGVAGRGFMMNKDAAVFNEVVRPKIEGTWVLDRLTDNDDLDFFIVFSSITALLGGEGQSDYTAANAYLDAFAEYRTKRGTYTTAVNWPAWCETGMAVDNLIDDDDTVFMSISNAAALKTLSSVLANRASRIVPADLNDVYVYGIKNELPFALSGEIMSRLEKHAQRQSLKPADMSRREVVIKGKMLDDLTTFEYELSHIYAGVLGIDEIDMYANFQDMGGNSLLAMDLLKKIDATYAGSIDIADIYSYPSVVQIAEYIGEKMGTADSEQSSDDVETILENLLDDTISLEDALDSL